MAAVVESFPSLPSEVEAVGPATLSERLGQLLTCDSEEFLSSGARVKLFARIMEGWVYYMPDTKEWCVWDGETSRWNRGEAETTILPLMEDYLARMLEIAIDRRIAIVGGETGLLSNKALYDLLRRIRHSPKLHRPSIEWDCNPHLLGVDNGVVDLRDGRLYTSCRGAYVTMHAPTAYRRRRVHSDRWDKLLLDITREDRDLRLFLRNWFGSLLTGSNPRERFTLLYGPGGTGKGTLMSAIMGCLGPYAMTIPADTICKRYGGGGGAREDLADMTGRRLVVCLEMTNEAELDPTLIKTLTGQDVIRARGLYQRGRHITPTWSLVACANSWPQLSSPPDSGWWRRMLAIPFLHRPAYPDLALKAHLVGDQTERESILSWLIAGSVTHYRRYAKARHWAPPAAVSSALAQYRVQYSPLGYWLESCVRRDVSHTLTNTEVFESYAKWCDLMGIWDDDRVDSRVIGRLLSAEGYRRCRVREGDSIVRAWSGFRLVDPSTPPELDWESDGMRVTADDFEV